MQEVWDHDGSQAEEIADGLGYEIAYAPACRMEDGRIQGNALLSRLPLADVWHVPLPTGGHEPRALLHARAGGLSVFVTHLNWQPGHSAIRLEQARVIASHFTGAPTVLLGDFNAAPGSAEIRYLSGVLTDAWFESGDGTAGHTFATSNGYVGGQSIRLDYIFTNARPISTWLAFTTPSNVDGVQTWPSDHYGIATNLDL